jgi:hypothetical protein
MDIRDNSLADWQYAFDLDSSIEPGEFLNMDWSTVF